MLTKNDLHRLDETQEVLVSRCMRERGFRYIVVAPDPALADARDFPYGIDDPRWARRHGLGLALRAAAAHMAGPTNPNNRYVASLSPERRRAYETALFGTEAATASVTIPTGDVVTTSTDGCLATAQDRLYGDVRRWFRVMTITNNLASVIEPKVLADPRYRQRLSVWSACMEEQGYHYRSPADLRARLGQVGPERERAVAVAEATCVRRTGLAALGRSLDQELGAPVRAQYRVEIRSYRQMRAAALNRIDTLDDAGAAAGTRR